MLEKDCNGNPISTFPPYYAFQMIFTALASRLIQSISRNVHNKFWALRQLCQVFCLFRKLYIDRLCFRWEESTGTLGRGTNTVWNAQISVCTWMVDTLSTLIPICPWHFFKKEKEVTCFILTILHLGSQFLWKPTPFLNRTHTNQASFYHV